MLEAAADWFARLGDERASADDTRQWQVWLDARPEHRRAWDAVAAISARFESVAGQPALEALTGAGRGRRRAAHADAAGRRRRPGRHRLEPAGHPPPAGRPAHRRRPDPPGHAGGRLAAVVEHRQRGQPAL
ncbi:DUF4880 domain-containing protein [Achromobacter insuavis]